MRLSIGESTGIGMVAVAVCLLFAQADDDPFAEGAPAAPKAKTPAAKKPAAKAPAAKKPAAKKPVGKPAEVDPDDPFA